MPTCPFCKRSEHQKPNGIVAGKQRYKCRYCQRNYTEGVRPRAKAPVTPPILNKCLQCGVETPNPKFCSLSCSSIYGNTYHPRNHENQKKPRFCKYCNVPVTNRNRVCIDCNPNNVDWSKRTLGELQNSAKYQVNAALRVVARRIFRESNRPRVCQNCGYSLHVEICHIRAINSFPADTPVSVVSGIDNLIALCPNCHWEFDHHQLTIADILGDAAEIPVDDSGQN